jgi:alpha-mannosidase
VTLDNIWRDHRLRMYLPLPEHADRSEAGCSFALVERALVAEGGPNELGLPTYPARHFVRAGGLLVAFDAVTEYEVVEARELALTVVRATGMLSRGPMATRPLPAGPELPLEGAQMRGCVERRFAIARAAHVDPWDLVDAFTPCPTTAARGGGHRPATGSLLDVRGAEVSAVLRDDDGLVLRVYNPRPTSSTLFVDGRRGRIVDLRGADLGPFDGTIELGPWQIATLTLE